jgi:hypothetical protein
MCPAEKSVPTQDYGQGKWFAVPLLIALDFAVALSIAVVSYLLYTYAFISPEHRVNDLKVIHESPNLNSNPGFAPLSATLYPAFLRQYG